VNYKEFGRLIKALRLNSYDERGAKLTRQKLSESVNLTPDQLGRLERGDRKFLDNATFHLLANSFNLTNLEKRELLIIYANISNEKPPEPSNSETQLDGLIAILEKLNAPAYVTDAYCNIVAINAVNLALQGLTADIIDYLGTLPVGYNMLYSIYAPELNFKELLGEKEWENSAYIAMLFFRRSTLPYRHTKYFNYLLQTLKREKQFAIDWYISHREQEHTDISYQVLTYEHPLYGPLCYLISETIIKSAQGNHCLFIYNAMDETTTSAFREMHRQSGSRVQRLAPWPDKRKIG
jgi:transcriptional regulator with XRE-family HTH domain